MASGISPWRVSIIDTRGELALSFDGSGATVDLLTGYPKSVGIEIAARTMNPELMVCDEIGDAEEARAIIGAQNCGVPLLASAHGADLGGLLRRTGIRELHIAGVFDSRDGNVKVSLFRDYRKVGEWTAVGRLSQPVGAGLRLGLAFDDAVPFVGAIDELRITSGVLTPDRFMRASGPGFLLHFR
jgi:hypothetical protein